jgi:ribosomal protein S18 acetylase RimI-like enzyme
MTAVTTTPPLPAGWTIRPPTRADAPEILSMVHASDIAAVGEPDFSLDDVVEVMTAPHHDPARDSWVTLDPTGAIVGWAYLRNPTGAEREVLDNYAHPERGVAGQATLLWMALSRMAERAAEFGFPHLTARAPVIASEVRYVDLLRTAGFAFVKRSSRMRLALSGPVAPPAPPPGVTVRTVRPGDADDLATVHRLLTDAFADQPDAGLGDLDTYRARVAALPGVSWDEWFVAEVDGEPAAALESGPPDVDEGWIYLVGVARRFSGRGLGQLLLRHAFAVYAAKGRTSAGLGVDMTNPTRAYRVYERVGLRPVYEVDIYERPVAAAVVGDRAR